MARVYDTAYFRGGLVPIGEATLSVAGSAVLYGLSVYTVFPICRTPRGRAAFRLPEHYRRLVQSSRIIGIELSPELERYEDFEAAVRKLASVAPDEEEVFVRASVHVDALVPGTRSRGLPTVLSMFMYEAASIVPQDGARLKTSLWRRVPDTSIPSRAKVNGAYVNSVLAKQDALDSGYDDCVFLDAAGHVCELSAANVFLVREGTLITPGPSQDLLEGINRRTILELARAEGIPTEERTVDLTEFYVADEVFACGTSAFVAFVKEIDGRMIGDGTCGPVTARLRELHNAARRGDSPDADRWLTALE